MLSESTFAKDRRPQDHLVRSTWTRSLPATSLHPSHLSAICSLDLPSMRKRSSRNVKPVSRCTTGTCQADHRDGIALILRYSYLRLPGRVGRLKAGFVLSSSAAGGAHSESMYASVISEGVEVSSCNIESPSAVFVRQCCIEMYHLLDHIHPGSLGVLHHRLRIGRVDHPAADRTRIRAAIYKG